MTDFPRRLKECRLRAVLLILVTSSHWQHYPPKPQETLPSSPCRPWICSAVSPLRAWRFSTARSGALPPDLPEFFRTATAFRRSKIFFSRATHHLARNVCGNNNIAQYAKTIGLKTHLVPLQLPYGGNSAWDGFRRLAERNGMTGLGADSTRSRRTDIGDFRGFFLGGLDLCAISRIICVVGAAPRGTGAQNLGRRWEK